MPVLRSVYQLTRTRLDVECRFLISPEVPVTQILRNMTGEHVDDRPSVSVRRRVWLSLRGDDVSDSVYWPNFHRGSRSSVVGERFSPKYLASKNKKGDKRGGNLKPWYRRSANASERVSGQTRLRGRDPRVLKRVGKGRLPAAKVEGGRGRREKATDHCPEHLFQQAVGHCSLARGGHITSFGWRG